MYSITDYNAFESVPEYMDKIRQYCSKADVPILLVGNKTDLESERCVTKEALKRFATENKRDTKSVIQI
jgi:GTPase SAR1 family protein